MLFKKLCVVIVAIVVAALPAVADNWIMVLSTDDGWTYDNETVSVSYSFERNVTKYGGYVQPVSCEPKILAKIKNNTDEFIYIDLSKTYITRNGEAEIYQNIVAMSTEATKKGDEDAKDNNKISQSVMPVPPHASKTFTFPIFPAKHGSYDNLIIYEGVYDRLEYKSADKAYLNEVFEYNVDNSPIRTYISFSYSTTEQGEKPAKVNKEFYVSFAAAVNNTKPKDFEAVLPNADNYNWFTMQASVYSFEKKKVDKAKKDKKKDKKDKKDKKKDKKSGMGSALLGGRR